MPIETIPLANRTLKAIVQTVHGYEQAPTSNEFAWLVKLQSENKLEQQMDEEKLTKFERDRLLDYLKIELREIEARKRSADVVKEAFKRVQVGYILLPCGHQRRKSTAFSLSKPDEIRCFYPNCGRTFTLKDNTLVDTTNANTKKESRA